MEYEKAANRSTTSVFGSCGRTKNALSAVVVALLLLTGCRGDFDGNVVANTDVFRMDYAILDRREVSSLTLHAGDSLRVSIEQEVGTTDVTVGMDGEEPIYEGNGLANVEFTLNISKSGTYRIVVTGHDARGVAAFIRKAAKPETER